MQVTGGHLPYFDRHFNNTLATKIAMPEKTTMGPDRTFK